MHLDIETLHLDKGYDSAGVHDTIAEYGITDGIIAKRRKRGDPKPVPVPANTAGHTLGQRWPVERTNSWFTNFGQLRRNTDRKIEHSEAQFGLAIIVLLTAKLIDWRDRWDPKNPCQY